jgi:hypothetical protein
MLSEPSWPAATIENAASIEAANKDRASKSLNVFMEFERWPG